MEYLLESSDGYGALLVSDESSERMRAVIGKYSDTKIINSLHVTIMYDNSSPEIDYKPDPSKTYMVSTTDITMLGEADSKWRAIVLNLKSKELDDHHLALRKMGYKHSFDKFVPHVSIMYEPSEGDIDSIMSNKERIMKELNILTLTGEYFQPINKPDPSTA